MSDIPTFKNMIGNFETIGHCTLSIPPISSWKNQPKGKIAEFFQTQTSFDSQDFNEKRIPKSNLLACLGNVMWSAENNTYCDVLADLHKIKENDFIYMYIETVDIEKHIVKSVILERIFITEKYFESSQDIIDESLLYLKNFKNFVSALALKKEDLEISLQAEIAEKNRLKEKFENLSEKYENQKKKYKTLKRNISK